MLFVPECSASALEFARHISDSDTVNAVEVKGKVEPGDTAALRAYIASCRSQARSPPSISTRPAGRWRRA